MTRKELLDAAAGCVLHDRANQYGDVEDNFGRIAELWTKYLGVQLAPHDVAAMMVLLKIARLRASAAGHTGYQHHADDRNSRAGSLPQRQPFLKDNRGQKHNDRRLHIIAERGNGNGRIIIRLEKQNPVNAHDST